MSDSKKEIKEQKFTIGPHNYFGNNSFSGADMVAVMHITGINGINGTYTLGSLQTLSYSTSMQRMPIRSIGNVNAKDYVMGPRTIAGSLVFAVFDRHFAYEAMKAIRGITEEDYHFLADELPPFDITITFANEYGKVAKLAIYGVRLVNEGQVMSINDIFTENTYQYVATDIDYLSDQSTNTSGAIYNPLKPNPNSTSNPVVIEDIVVEEPDEEIDDIARYQVVYVKPTDACVVNGIQYNGKASLDLFKRVKYGEVVLNNLDTSEERRMPLEEGTQFPLIADDLVKGKYSVFYFSGKSNSKTTYFTINNKTSDTPVPSRPVIVLEEKKPDNSFTIGVQATDDITKGIQYTDNISDPSSWKNVDPVTPSAIINGLKEYNTYWFRSYNDGATSESISCYADAKKEHLFSDFREFVLNNQSFFGAEWIYVIGILDTSYDQWLVTPTFSVVTALSNIKSKVDLTNPSKLIAYEKLCSVATLYEQKHREYASQGTIMNTPKVVNVGMCQIEFDKNTVSLTIKHHEKGFTKSVGKNFFQDCNTCYRYVVTSKYAGAHNITANGPNGAKSPTLSMHIPEKMVALDMIDEQRTNDILLQQQLAAAAIKGLNSEEAIGTKVQDKDLLLREVNNNANIVKQGLIDPLIVYMNDKEVNITCQIVVPAGKNYYLCLSATQDIGNGQLKQRVPILGTIFNYSFYKSKHALIQGKRYSVWIEDSSDKIVSGTTSFDFNAEQSVTGDLKNSEIVTAVKDSFGYRHNKEKTDDFKSESLLSEGKIYSSIIVSNMLDIPSSDKWKMDYLYDAITGRHKRTNVSLSKTSIDNIKFNVPIGSLTGDFKLAGYTMAVLVQYDNSGDSNTKPYVAANDNTFYLSDINTSQYEYAYLYFTNDSCSKVSDIILLQYDTKQLMSDMKVQVTW